MTKGLLLNPLPQTVNTSAGTVSINPDWKIMARLEVLLTESDPMDEDEQATSLLLEFLPSAQLLPLDEISDILKWFYTCGKDDTPNDESSDEYSESNERLYSFAHDADLIYSAFVQSYGIDLIEDKLHWWKFRALFNSLPADCQFVKIISFRSMEIDSSMSDGEKEYYRKMKRKYALPLPQSEQEKLDKLTAALLGDGNISELI